MKQTIRAALIITLMAILMAGCGKTPPKCSDENTFSLIRQILINHLGGHEGLSDKELQDNIRFEYSRATAFDEKIKKYSCEAKLIAVVSFELPITYESQLDDNNQHIVELGGITQGDLYMLKSAITQGLEKSRVVQKPVDAPHDEPTQSAPIASVSAPVAAPVAKNIETTPARSWSPSFDCTKASTFAEKEVCSDTLLGKLDGALSENYKSMLASDIGEGAAGDLKATQKKWMKERNKCTSRECLIASYKKRIDEVCEYPVLSGSHPDCTASEDIK